MKPWVELVVGLVSFLLGLGYLYRPDLITRMNAILREYLINDAHIALERKKWGIFFLLIAFLFLYMAMTVLTRHP